MKKIVKCFTIKKRRKSTNDEYWVFEKHVTSENKNVARKLLLVFNGVLLKALRKWIVSIHRRRHCCMPLNKLTLKQGINRISIVKQLYKIYFVLENLLCLILLLSKDFCEKNISIWYYDISSTQLFWQPVIIINLTSILL